MTRTEFTTLTKGNLVEINGTMLIATSDIYTHFDSEVIDLADVDFDEDGVPTPTEKGSMYTYEELRNGKVC